MEKFLLDENKNGFDIDVDLSFKNGVYMEEPFDEMVISGLYKDGILHLDDLSMTKEKSIGLHADGIIPLKTKNSHVDISMKSSFSNLSLKFINRFIPNFFNIGGFATGTINLNGTSEETHFSYNINIDRPEFELVQMEILKSKGFYNGKSLHVEMAQAKNKNGHINTSGYIPFDLNIGSGNFGSFFPYDSIILKTDADLSDLPFLSPYITDLDSAVGNYKIKLNIEGPINNLRRDGSILIQNGILYTQLLNDPIRFVNGQALLTNNLLTIENFAAGIAMDEGNSLKEKFSNTQLKGEIKLNSFLSLIMTLN